MGNEGVSLAKEVTDNRRALNGLDRQFRLDLDISKPEKYCLIFSGYILAAVDVFFTWQQFYGLSSAQGVKLAFGSAGIALGIIQFIITPIALKSIPKGIWFRTIPMLAIGLTLTCIDIGATIGFMSSSANSEEARVAQIKERRAERKMAITALSSSIQSSEEAARVQRDTQQGLNDLGRLSKANNSASTLLSIERNKAKVAKDLVAISQQEPKKIESESQLSSLYISVSNIFHIDYSVARKWCEIIFSVMIPLGSICALTLGRSDTKLKARLRHEEPRDAAENVNEQSDQEPLQATVAAVRDVPGDVGVSLGKPESSPNRYSSILKNALDKLTEKEETLLRSAIEMIKAGKLQNLSHGNLQKQLSCGSEASAMIRSELIKKKYALERGRRLMVNPIKIDKN